MKIGTLALECHGTITGDRIVVSRAEINLIDVHVRMLSSLVARYGEHVFGAKFGVGKYCTFDDGRISFDVVCSAGSISEEFRLHSFVDWCKNQETATRSESNGADYKAGCTSTGGGLAVLTLAEAKQLGRSGKQPAVEFVNDVLERVSQAVRITTFRNSYVIIGANAGDYIKDAKVLRPHGEPWGQLPLLALGARTQEA